MMDVKKIEELIKVVEDSQTEELSVRKGGFAVHIVKGKKPKPANTKKPVKVAEARSDEPASNDSEFYILAPMVGIFHSADGIAKVGSSITKGQVVGSIESMKLQNDVVSDVTGTVVEVLIEDGTPVEYGQPLCKIEAV